MNKIIDTDKSVIDLFKNMVVVPSLSSLSIPCVWEDEKRVQQSSGVSDTIKLPMLGLTRKSLHPNYTRQEPLSYSITYKLSSYSLYQADANLITEQILLSHPALIDQKDGWATRVTLHSIDFHQNDKNDGKLYIVKNVFTIVAEVNYIKSA